MEIIFPGFIGFALAAGFGYDKSMQDDAHILAKAFADLWRRQLALAFQEQAVPADAPAIRSSKTE